jgi:hypothetical protein
MTEALCACAELQQIRLPFAEPAHEYCASVNETDAEIARAPTTHKEVRKVRLAHEAAQDVGRDGVFGREGDLGVRLLPGPAYAVPIRNVAGLETISDESERCPSGLCSLLEV